MSEAEQSAENTKLLRDAVREGIAATLRANDAKSVITDIIEVTAEKLEMDKAELRKMIAVGYKKEYDNENYLKEYDRVHSAYQLIEDM